MKMWTRKKNSQKVGIESRIRSEIDLAGLTNTTKKNEWTNDYDIDNNNGALGHSTNEKPI